MAAAAEEYGENMVTLQSSDGKVFELQKAVALKSNVLKMTLRGVQTKKPIRLQNVSSNILKMVIDYSEYHHLHDDSLDAAATEKVKKWDAEFVNGLVDDVATLIQLTMASHFLQIDSLLDLTSETIAALFTGKTLQQIRTTFNIVNDFSPDEKAEIWREHQLHRLEMLLWNEMLIVL